MAYDSVNGRRPMEYASKINHSAIIKSQEISEFFESYQTVEFDMGKHIMPKGFDIKYGTPKNIKHIFAIDGSYKDISINLKFPSISLAYFNIGVLSFDMLDYDALTTSNFINPALLKKIKDVSKVCFTIPTNNIIKKKGKVCYVDKRRIKIKCKDDIKENLLDGICCLFDFCFFV